MSPQVQPLSYQHRNVFFYLLMGVFMAALPFLFLYATGYRFYSEEGMFISTGGLYIAAERTGAEIYINDELVRETRVFRRAFYAQGLEARTHKVHVQKVGHHTWVKELPVYSHLVTEAQSFNLPITPSARLVTPFVTSAGVAVLTSSSSVLNAVQVTNQVLIEPRAATSTMSINPEYVDLIRYFASSTESEKQTIASYIGNVLPEVASTEPEATTTNSKISGGVLLTEVDDNIFARYVGPQNSMPYYYCAESFLPYEEVAATSTRSSFITVAEAKEVFENDLMLEVQKVEDEAACDPVISIDTGGEEVSYFDFFPNSTDLVILGLESGIYVIEIDDRGWQNKQPLLVGNNLSVRVINGSINISDGVAIYQIQTQQNWF